MKVVVQVPCLNEEETLPSVFERMPRQIPGVDSIDFLVIDDGSRDRTWRSPGDWGSSISSTTPATWAWASHFTTGSCRPWRWARTSWSTPTATTSTRASGSRDLIRPILDGEADIVIADRQTHTIEHFSPLKKRLQRLGSRVVNFAADTDLPDAASGFRAYSREALIRLNPVTRFSYCMETIIQAGNKRLGHRQHPGETNPKTRESRLFQSTAEHVVKSAATIVRAYIMYKPMTVFLR